VAWPHPFSSTTELLTKRVQLPLHWLSKMDISSNTIAISVLLLLLGKLKQTTCMSSDYTAEDSSTTPKSNNLTLTESVSMSGKCLLQRPATSGAMQASMMTIVCINMHANNQIDSQLISQLNRNFRFCSFNCLWQVVNWSCFTLLLPTQLCGVTTI